MRKTTPAQLRLLVHCLDCDGALRLFRGHPGLPDGDGFQVHPHTIEACIRHGWLRLDESPGPPTFWITDAGRVAAGER